MPPASTNRAAQRRLTQFVGIAFAVAIMAASACTGDNVTGRPTGGGLTGTYTLQTVNGDSMPATVFQDGAVKLEVLGATYTFSDDGTFTHSSAYRETIGGIVRTLPGSANGAYVVDGDSVTFRVTQSGRTQTESASLSGDTLTFRFTFSDPGGATSETWVFLK